MACKEFTKEIDGVLYRTIQFPTRQGIGIKTRLLKVGGPFLQALNGQMGQIDIVTFTNSLNSEEVITLILDLLSLTFRGPKKIDSEVLDVDFAGEYVTLYSVLIFVIESNRFFGKLNITEALKSLRQEASQILSPESMTV